MHRAAVPLQENVVHADEDKYQVPCIWCMNIEGAVSVYGDKA